MGQAAFADGRFPDLSLFLDDGAMTPEGDVGACEVAEALVVAPVIVLIDEGADPRLQITRQEVVFEQDTVLQGLMPAFDLPLCLEMVRRAANVVHTLIF